MCEVTNTSSPRAVGGSVAAYPFTWCAASASLSQSRWSTASACFNMLRSLKICLHGVVGQRRFRRRASTAHVVRCFLGNAKSVLPLTGSSGMAYASWACPMCVPSLSRGNLRSYIYLVSRVPLRICVCSPQIVLCACGTLGRGRRSL